MINNLQIVEMTDRDRRDRPPDMAAIQQQSSATSEDRNPLLPRDDGLFFTVAHQHQFSSST